MALGLALYNAWGVTRFSGPTLRTFSFRLVVLSQIYFALAAYR